MKKIRNSFFTKPFSILLSILFLNLSLGSCKKDNNTEKENSGSNNVSTVTYDNQAIVTDVNADGKVEIKSFLISEGNEYDLTYQLTIVDPNGNPIPNAKVLYNQINEKSIIYVYDSQNQYVSTFFIGTPNELNDYFNGKDSPQNLKSEQGVILLTFAILVTLVSITIAEIGIILDTYKIQQFYLTDYVEETEDYIKYCKTFEEIGELIYARTAITLGITSIFISFLTTGMPSGNEAISITWDAGLGTAEAIRDELLHQAIDQWGVAMDELVGKKVGVKVYPYEEDNSFSNVQNLFAVCEIIYDDPQCAGAIGEISGQVSDATTGNPINNVLIQLSGDDWCNDYTNSQGGYSFQGISEGNYTITASKNGYITDSKDFTFDGSSMTVNFVLSESLGSNEYRIVLTWGELPTDLDLHLYTENGDHIYWNNQGSITSYPYIFLDLDDINSYGPETITINDLQPSEIYVHNYSGEHDGDIDIKQSNAEISVYKGNLQIRNYEVPNTGNGYWWYVFDIDENGTITDQNYLLNTYKSIDILNSKKQQNYK